MLLKSACKCILDGAISSVFQVRKGVTFCSTGSVSGMMTGRFVGIQQGVHAVYDD